MSPERRERTPRHHMAVPESDVVREYVRVLGLRLTLTRGVYVLLNQIVPVTVLDGVRLDPENVNPDCLVGDGSLECRFLEPDEIRRPRADWFLPPMPEVVEERLANGDLCHAVLDGDVIASVGWYSKRPTTILGDLTVHFDPERWFMYGAVTRPEYRGRQLHGLGVCRAFVALHERGVKGLVSTWERTNYRTIHSAVRMGWKRFGSLFRVRVGGRSFVGATPGCRAHGMRLETRAGITIRDA